MVAAVTLRIYQTGGNVYTHTQELSTTRNVSGTGDDVVVVFLGVYFKGQSRTNWQGPMEISGF